MQSEPLPLENIHLDANAPDLLTAVRMQGLDVVAGDITDSWLIPEPKSGDGEDEVELDLNTAAPDASTDPVRLYLHEMGATSLLTREQEVEIFKRIERGQRRVMKALSRSPFALRQVLAVEPDLESGVRSIRDIVLPQCLLPRRDQRRHRGGWCLHQRDSGGTLTLPSALIEVFQRRSPIHARQKTGERMLHGASFDGVTECRRVDLATIRAPARRCGARERVLQRPQVIRLAQ